MTASDPSPLRTVKAHPIDDESLRVASPMKKLGWDGSRPLTSLERTTIAVSSAKPTHHLTVTSQLLDRHEFIDAFELLRAHMMRVADQAHRPFIYLGVVANACGKGGWHGHFLLWRSFPANSLRKHAVALGLGRQLKITLIGPTLLDRLYVARYVLSQHEAVFGSQHHADNHAREKHSRRYIASVEESLWKDKPELLHALQMAKNKAVTDTMLVSSLPILHEVTTRL